MANPTRPTDCQPDKVILAGRIGRVYWVAQKWYSELVSLFITLLQCSVY